MKGGARSTTHLFANKTMNLTYENEIIISGTIVHKFCNEKVTILTISTGMMNNYVQYPTFYFFGEKGKEVAETFDQYDAVTAIGNIQSSVNRSSGKIHQIIFGENIKLELPDVPKDTLIFGHQTFKKRNFVKISGLVRNVTAHTKFVDIILETHKNGRLSTVRTRRYTDNPQALAEKIKQNVYISTIGSIQTNMEEKNGKKMYYEDVILSKVAA